MISREDLAANVEKVRQEVAAAAVRAGRRPEDVSLVGVTKTLPAKTVALAASLGLRDFGENKAQEFRDKYAALQGSQEGATTGIRWHFIGHLQANKVKYLIGKVTLIHSVDSLELLQEIDRLGRKAGVAVPVLLQLNISGEVTKSGMTESDLPRVLRGVPGLPFVRVEGLMTIAPAAADPEEARPVFRRLATVARELAGEKLAGVTMRHLSMGMSGDFTVAVEEGATLVRVGTAIFGPRS